MPAAVGRLRYIDAAHVLGPAGEFSDFHVRDAADRLLGKLNGFVLDPAARQLHYFVVEVRRWLTKQRYLVPICPATLQCDRQVVRFEVGDPAPSEWRKFDHRLYAPLSDKDAEFAKVGSPSETAEGG